MVEFINVNCTIQMANIEDRLNFRDHKRHFRFVKFREKSFGILWWTGKLDGVILYRKRLK